MPTRDRSWFERTVRELGDILRRFPQSRRRAFSEVIETGDDADARQGTGGRLDADTGESGDGAKKVLREPGA
jgi:hypothetical protein